MKRKKFSWKSENKQAVSAMSPLRASVTEGLKSYMREQAAPTNKVQESAVSLPCVFLQNLTSGWFPGLPLQAAKRKRIVAVLFEAKGILCFKNRQEQA